MKTRQKLFSVILSVCILIVLCLPAFAVSSNKDANACETLGLVIGTGDGVTDSYLDSYATRLQAATVLLRLYGLEEKANSFKGTENFADASKLAEVSDTFSKLAYLKAHPELGFVGDGRSFFPDQIITASQFASVLVVSLGYSLPDYKKSGTGQVSENTGLAPPAQKDAPLTVGDLCAGVVKALNTPLKGSDETLLEAMVGKKIVTTEAAQASGLLPPPKPKPIGFYMPVGETAQPTFTTVSYTAHKLTVKLDCSTTGATIYYTYSVEGTAAAPTSASPNHVSPGDSIEIDDTNVGDTINIKAIAVAPGFIDSSVGSYTRNGYKIEAITDPSVATLSGHTITLVSTVGATTVEILLAALQVSSGASVQVYETSGCMVGEKVDSGNICAGYTLRISSGYNADDINDYSFVLATAASLTANYSSGSYSGTLSVVLTSPSGGAIYYTLDGTTPTTDSTPFLTAISINADTTSTGTTKTLKAIAVVPGMQPSAVLVREYTFA